MTVSNNIASTLSYTSATGQTPLTGEPAAAAIDGENVSDKGQSSADKVTISDAAREKLMQEQQPAEESKSSARIAQLEATIERIKEQIQQAQEQLQEIQAQEMDKDSKDKLLEAKRNELMMLQASLTQATDALNEAKKKEAEAG
ncbi:hypothetical protein [Ferrimonas aestuarii]|uniref:FlxA-like protein n=1 Tax=Ferrimonas aestuarii TaxID=2569539 RepID=A0A4U1BQI5_9GAMM|nr:hypothetical protein [Ferrimonas aestuarii]TKB54940.1 hypothetical protein FCL42_10250 [Ferrimonas aestuarii]